MEVLNKKDCPTAFHYNYLTHSCVVPMDKELSWDEAKINCETNLTSAGRLLEIKNSDVQMWVDNLREAEGGKAIKTSSVIAFILQETYTYVAVLHALIGLLQTGRPIKIFSMRNYYEKLL